MSQQEMLNKNWKLKLVPHVLNSKLETKFICSSEYHIFISYIKKQARANARVGD